MSSATPPRADANPDKLFFVDSITKDISLLDCVLDLIDNAIDSAASKLNPGDVLNVPDCLKDKTIKINFSPTQFKISDNATGISLEDAKDPVFRFGTLKKDSNESIGYYGIGLKRATFKMGKKIVVKSITSTEHFDVNVDIPIWLDAPTDWTFPISVYETNGNFTDTGVEITIDDLYKEISETFDAPEFKSKLIETIGRDYYFFLKAGLNVEINNDPISPAELGLKNSGDFIPGISEYNDDGVHIKIVSGCHSHFEDQDDPDNFDPKVSGWYVICNNRIILAANKDEKTVWKGRTAGFTYWHPQYNGFIGFIFFNSSEQKKLPWTTTKRDIDLESKIYRSALPQMYEMTKPWIQYTGHRKSNPEAAKTAEIDATTTSLSTLAVAVSVQKKPSFPKYQAQDIVKFSTISYKVERYKIDKSKVTLGNPTMSNGDLGKYTFDYYYKNEIE